MALIPYADESPANDRVRSVIDRLPEPRINLFRMLANAPALIGPTLRLGEAILTRGELEPELRELVILHTARSTGTEYEWAQHAEIARLIGVAEAKIDAVGRGELVDQSLSASQRLALRLVEQLLEAGTPGPDLVKRVEAELGRAQLLELLIVAGYYAMLGGVMRAVRIDVDNVVEKGMLDGGRRATGG
jgi:alkylhydroperoxidase family enzyme